MPNVPSKWATKIPTNMNPLAPSGFKILITKLPMMQFYCQSINLPSITLGVGQFTTPQADIPIPGEKLEFGELNVQFLVDESMENYKAINDWLFGLGSPVNDAQYTNFLSQDTVAQGSSELTKGMSDASLFILTNNNTESKIVTFKNMFPISLESLTFTGIDTDVNYLIGNATFKYTYYVFES